MRKILVFILCALLLIAMPVAAFADEAEPTVEENVPPVEESATEDEIEPSITETIVEWVKGNFEEITVIFGLLASAFYGTITRKGLNGSIGTLNNNAITIAENSAKAIETGVEKMEAIANRVIELEKKVDAFLERMEKNAEEKLSLEETLSQVSTFLKSAKLANLELSNEVAELLVLANIPNSKKEELYSRHTKAVHDLEVVEEEVIHNDGEKA